MWLPQMMKPSFETNKKVMVGYECGFFAHSNSQWSENYERVLCSIQNANSKFLIWSKKKIIIVLIGK